MKPYWSGFVCGFRRAMASPGELIVRMGFFAIVLLVSNALWTAALDANGGELHGYDLKGLLWYIFGAQTAYIGVRPRTIEEVGNEIGTGSVAVSMLRPVSVVGLRMSIEVGEAIGRLLGAIVFGAVVTYLFVGAPPSTPAIALAVPAILLGCTCNIVSQHAFGGIAFWLRDAKSTWFVYQKLVFLPGGVLLPLEMLPHWLEVPCKLLPFATMAYVPGRIASGHVDPLLMASQIGWLAVLLLAAIRVFGAGQRRLELVGG